jgi:hypothetical protein
MIWSVKSSDVESEKFILPKAQATKVARIINFISTLCFSRGRSDHNKVLSSIRPVSFITYHNIINQRLLSARTLRSLSETWKKHSNLIGCSAITRPYSPIKLYALIACIRCSKIMHYCCDLGCPDLAKPQRSNNNYLKKNFMSPTSSLFLPILFNSSYVWLCCCPHLFSCSARLSLSAILHKHRSRRLFIFFIFVLLIFTIPYMVM